MCFELSTSTGSVNYEAGSVNYNHGGWAEQVVVNPFSEKYLLLGIGMFGGIIYFRLFLISTIRETYEYSKNTKKIIK